MSTSVDGRRGTARGRTFREPDAFREIASGDFRTGDADWWHVLVTCAADLSAVPDTAVLATAPDGRFAVAAASTPDVRAGTEALVEAGWEPFRECVDGARRVSADPRTETTQAGRRMPAVSFAGVHLFPVAHGHDTHGAVLLCDRIPGRLGEREAAAVGFVAGLAGLLLSHEQDVAGARRTAAQLQAALDSRVVVEQAKGYVAGRDGGGLGAAFRLLRDTARRERRALVDIAREALPPD